MVQAFTIDIRCQFISGSDALGCTVLLVSNCLRANDKHVNLTRIGRMASKTLTLPHDASCYRQVVAHGISINYTFSKITIEEEIDSCKSSTIN